MIRDAAKALKEIGPSFKLEPFASIIQPIIREVLCEYNKDKYRKGTILTPLILVWLILALPLRRDLSCRKTLNWLLSGYRWVNCNMPAKIVADGTISHARVKLGIDVIRSIFYRSAVWLKNVEPDFHGRTTVIFDGTSMTMPDTESNEKKIR